MCVNLQHFVTERDITGGFILLRMRINLAVVLALLQLEISTEIGNLEIPRLFKNLVYTLSGQVADPSTLTQ